VAADWFTSCDKDGFIPGIHLYNLGVWHDGGDVGLLKRAQMVHYMTRYFAEFKRLMQLAKAYGKPVLLVVEGDTFGYLQMLSLNDGVQADASIRLGATGAAVKSTGMAELQGLGDTIWDIWLAFLAIRKAVGATNVFMGPDVPAYASGGDILFGDGSDLAEHVAHQAGFFMPLGLGDNVTGERFDFAGSNPLCSQADAFWVLGGLDWRWWDSADDAPESSQSFNRYAAWLRLFNQASGRRSLLHQIPAGDSNSPNTGGTSGDYGNFRDNKAEYFLGYDATCPASIAIGTSTLHTSPLAGCRPSSRAIRNVHLQKFVDAGVMAILFGKTDQGPVAPHDLWVDGSSFLTSRAHELIQVDFAASGGFPVTRAGAP